MHTGVGYEECVGEGAANESTTFWIRTTYDAQLLVQLGWQSVGLQASSGRLAGICICQEWGLAGRERAGICHSIVT
eukprot:scaffold22200_cov27-Tisochrysis_lutea.AAC.1